MTDPINVAAGDSITFRFVRPEEPVPDYDPLLMRCRALQTVNDKYAEEVAQKVAHIRKLNEKITELGDALDTVRDERDLYKREMQRLEAFFVAAPQPSPEHKHIYAQARIKVLEELNKQTNVDLEKELSVVRIKCDAARASLNALRQGVSSGLKSIAHLVDELRDGIE